MRLTSKKLRLIPRPTKKNYKSILYSNKKTAELWTVIDAAKRKGKRLSAVSWKHPFLMKIWLKVADCSTSEGQPRQKLLCLTGIIYNWDFNSRFENSHWAAGRSPALWTLVWCLHKIYGSSIRQHSHAFIYVPQLHCHFCYYGIWVVCCFISFRTIWTLILIEMTRLSLCSNRKQAFIVKLICDLVRRIQRTRLGKYCHLLYYCCACCLSDCRLRMRSWQFYQ